MKQVYLILAALLLICLAPMPYWYYMLVRFGAMAVFAYFAYSHFTQKEEGLGFMFLSLSLLFQPFLKIALGRTLWNVVDVIVAIVLVILWYRKR